MKLVGKPQRLAKAFHPFFLPTKKLMCCFTTVGFTKKKGYCRLFNSYVANTVRFANRNSLGMAPPLACRALTMVKFPTKNGYDGLHCQDQFLNCSAILSTQSPLNNLVYRLGRLHSRAKKNYTDLMPIHNNQPMRMAWHYSRLNKRLWVPRWL